MEIALKYKRIFSDMSLGTLRLSPSSFITATISSLTEGIAPVLFKIILNTPQECRVIGEGKAPSYANAKKQINTLVDEFLVAESRVSVSV